MTDLLRKMQSAFEEHKKEHAQTLDEVAAANAQYSRDRRAAGEADAPPPEVYERRVWEADRRLSNALRAAYVGAETTLLEERRTCFARVEKAAGGFFDALAALNTHDAQHNSLRHDCGRDALPAMTRDERGLTVSLTDDLEKAWRDYRALAERGFARKPAATPKPIVKQAAEYLRALVAS